MRIAFVITGLNVGGAEKMVTSLADAMAARGHEVMIAYLTGSAKVLPSDASIVLVGLGLSSARQAASAFWRLRTVLRDFQPDVVHSHMVHANILARLVRLCTPIPRLICTAHNTDEGGALRMLAYRLTDRLADLSTNVSQEAVATFERRKAVRRGRMLAVTNGVSTSTFSYDPSARSRIRQELGIQDFTTVILAVGRMEEQKDYPNLFRAVAQMIRDKRDFVVCIAGDGPLRGSLEALLQELGIASHVRLLGVRRDIPHLLSAADIFVLSSAWEGMPLVTLEAMSSERVVVATDCGGVREVLDGAGYLVQPRDSRALADALMRAMSLSAPERQAMGRSARERIQRDYSLDRVISNWSSLYFPAETRLGNMA
jgi:glycosyltransferase involved in cell wall biosynthesis